MTNALISSLRDARWAISAPYRNAKQSGYTSEKCGGHVSLYRFPFDQELRQKWLRAINRQDVDNYTDNWRVCAEHFTEIDFLNESEDTHTTRLNQRESKTLKVKKLKSSAIPSIFKGQPSYLTSTSVQRSTLSTSSLSRLKKENQRILSLEKELFEKEDPQLP